MPANTQSLSYGLRIADLTVGTGATPTAGQTCTVHYTGWLKENGKQFETSVGKTPYSFQISRGGVIRGWDEGIITMKVGGKRKLEIPPLLAYGESGANGVIPSNATLIFDIELLSVK
ncbi:MAG: FKBP-type peptidyl-prolyl cis-trans isomerase [Candidatus Sericytochromatia bacterium]|nr:FKBP-type peptidyl-prolyl cis-trans isomerase [Candidatus Sericytochromatia bacterium]